MFMKIREDYDNPPVYILENGVASDDSLVDEVRGLHYQKAISAVLRAIREGCDIRIYTAWSLMDNFEWSQGYTFVLFIFFHAFVL